MACQCERCLKCCLLWWYNSLGGLTLWKILLTKNETVCKMLLTTKLLRRLNWKPIVSSTILNAVSIPWVLSLAYYFKITLLFEATQYTKNDLSFLYISTGLGDWFWIWDPTNACQAPQTHNPGFCFCLSKCSLCSVLSEYLPSALCFHCMILLLLSAQVALLSGYLKFSFDGPATKQLNYEWALCLKASLFP